MMEKTVVLVKPDGLQRGLVGEIIHRFERKGLKLVGITKAREAEAGSIRGDFGMSGSNNIIHASDSPEFAEKELGLIFNGDEIFDYDSATDLLIYSKEEVDSDSIGVDK